MAAHPSIVSHRPSAPAVAAPPSRVVAFPHRRAILNVTLCHAEDDRGEMQLRRVFRSALGVYVLDSRVEKHRIKLRFDIAVNDVDFILHTLIRDLPEATIGPLEPRRIPRHAAAASSDLRLGFPTSEYRGVLP